MFDRFTDRTTRVMHLATAEARKLRRGYLGSENVLIGLLEEGSGIGGMVLKDLGLDVSRVRIEIEKMVPASVLKTSPEQLPFNAETKEMLEIAFRKMEELSHPVIGTEHILLALISNEGGMASQVITNLDVDLRKVESLVLSMLGVLEEEDCTIESLKDRALSELLGKKFHFTVAYAENEMEIAGLIVGATRIGNLISVHLHLPKEYENLENVAFYLDTNKMEVGGDTAKFISLS